MLDCMRVINLCTCIIIVVVVVNVADVNVRVGEELCSSYSHNVRLT